MFGRKKKEEICLFLQFFYLILAIIYINTCSHIINDDKLKVHECSKTPFKLKQYFSNVFLDQILSTIVLYL